jgi:hypothetical protein
MKTTMSKQILFLAALGCITAPVAAQTVDVTLQCGQAYAINSTVAASAVAGLTYRWLENGSTITGAAAPNYTVPATKSVGIYTYIRQAKSTGCTDWQSSNAFTVEVKNKNDDGVCINGLMWATRNVDMPGSFTEAIGDTGKFYQFNRTKAWDLKPVPSGMPIINENERYNADSSVCPTGWRLPTPDEYNQLFSITASTIGVRVYWEPPENNEYKIYIAWAGPGMPPLPDPTRQIPFFCRGYITDEGTVTIRDETILHAASPGSPMTRILIQLPFAHGNVATFNHNRALAVRCVQ